MNCSTDNLLSWANYRRILELTKSFQRYASGAQRQSISLAIWTTWVRISKTSCFPTSFFLYFSVKQSILYIVQQCMSGNRISFDCGPPRLSSLIGKSMSELDILQFLAGHRIKIPCDVYEIPFGDCKFHNPRKRVSPHSDGNSLP